MPTRVGQLPVVRRLKHLGPVEHAWDMGFRSRLVRERVRFTVQELSGRGGIARYRLAESGAAVHLRHGTSDLDILEEVFGMRLYAMPEAVSSRLSGRSPLRVLDLGGHVGLFGSWVRAAFPDVELTVVEADPANAAVQRRTIAAAGGDGWALIEAVAAPASGRIAFRAGAFAESGVAADGEPGSLVLPAVDALELMQSADLLKIDIEGGEWPILADPRFAATPLRAVALEYHPAGCPSGDPRAEAHRLLGEAGFSVQEIEGAPVGAGMLWAWRG